MWLGKRLTIAYLLNLFDFAATTYWVNRYGIGIEANPIGRWLYETGLACPVKTVVVGLLMLVLYAALRRHPKWQWTSWLILAVYGVFALCHIAFLIHII